MNAVSPLDLWMAHRKNCTAWCFQDGWRCWQCCQKNCMPYWRMIVNAVWTSDFLPMFPLNDFALHPKILEAEPHGKHNGFRPGSRTDGHLFRGDVLVGKVTAAGRTFWIVSPDLWKISTMCITHTCHWGGHRKMEDQLEFFNYSRRKKKDVSWA